MLDYKYDCSLQAENLIKILRRVSDAAARLPCVAVSIVDSAVLSFPLHPDSAGDYIVESLAQSFDCYAACTGKVVPSPNNSYPENVDVVEFSLCNLSMIIKALSAMSGNITISFTYSVSSDNEAVCTSDCSFSDGRRFFSERTSQPYQEVVNPKSLLNLSTAAHYTGDADSLVKVLESVQFAASGAADSNAPYTGVLFRDNFVTCMNGAILSRATLDFSISNGQEFLFPARFVHLLSNLDSGICNIYVDKKSVVFQSGDTLISIQRISGRYVDASRLFDYSQYRSFTVRSEEFLSACKYLNIFKDRLKKLCVKDASGKSIPYATRLAMSGNTLSLYNPKHTVDSSVSFDALNGEGFVLPEGVDAIGLDFKLFQQTIKHFQPNILIDLYYNDYKTPVIFSTNNHSYEVLVMPMRLR